MPAAWEGFDLVIHAAALPWCHPKEVVFINIDETYIISWKMALKIILKAVADAPGAAGAQ